MEIPPAQRIMERATRELQDIYRLLEWNNVAASGLDNAQYQAVFRLISDTLRQLRTIAPNTFAETYNE